MNLFMRQNFNIQSDLIEQSNNADIKESDIKTVLNNGGSDIKEEDIEFILNSGTSK